MYPPLFKLCVASQAVNNLLNDGPVLRIYAAGRADPTSTLPYVTWKTINGEPDNYMDGAPDIDYFDVRVNVYAADINQSREIARAIRQAVELDAYITRLGEEFIDPDTKASVYSFDIEFIVSR